ncbi:MAG: type II secretion system F family protein [Robiginitomaculum sp.]
MEFLTLSSEYKISIAVAFFAVSMVLVFLSVYGALFSQNRLDRRLVVNDGPKEPVARKGLFAKFASQITLPDEKEITRIRYLLSQAGFFSDNAVNIFYAIRVLAIIMPQMILFAFWGVLSSQFTPQTLTLLSVTLGFLGLLGPPIVVGKIKARRTLLAKDGFPDMMDLLLACIEAGLGLDAALLRVANELALRYPPLKSGLDLMNLELRAGRERHEALKNFAERLDLEEAKALAIMLRQSEEMGSGLGASLRTFSEEMRAKRMLLAEEKALALSAKLTIPLIIFIFPTILAMLILPAGIRLAAGLG